MNRVLITGSNGKLGGTLVKELVDNSDFGVVAVAGTHNKIFEMLDREKIKNRDKIIAMSNEEFFQNDWSNLKVFAAVHMAFSRAKGSNKDIADSLVFCRNTYHRLNEMNVPRVIYISSQSVYGDTFEFRSEYTMASPNIPYSMAKYAGEQLLEAEFDETDTAYTSLRLDYVIQSQNLVFALCRQAKESRCLLLKGGKQTFSYIDKRDVAKAIIALINYGGRWRRIYNVGPNEMRLSLVEIAEVVRTVAQNHGIEDISIQLDKDDTELWSGMDSSLFISEIQWKPSFTIDQMVESIFVEV